METLFDQYKELNINGSLICLEQVEDIYSYFCYPTNAKAIGFEGSIMYCFIEPYGEMVFACNPDTCADIYEDVGNLYYNPYFSFPDCNCCLEKKYLHP